MKTDKKIEEIIIKYFEENQYEYFIYDEETKQATIDGGYDLSELFKQINTEIQKAVEEAVRGFVDYAFKEAGVSYAEDGLEKVWEQMQVLFQGISETYLQSLKDKDSI